VPTILGKLDELMNLNHKALLAYPYCKVEIDVCGIFVSIIGLSF